MAALNSVRHQLLSDEMSLKYLVVLSLIVAHCEVLGSVVGLVVARGWRGGMGRHNDAILICDFLVD